MEDILLPSLKRGDTVIMDNLSIHKNSFDVRRFSRRGIKLSICPVTAQTLIPLKICGQKLSKLSERKNPGQAIKSGMR